MNFFDADFPCKTIHYFSPVFKMFAPSFFFGEILYFHLFKLLGEKNELTRKNFVFRSREFEQMEVEYFTKEEEWSEHLENWREIMNSFAREVGIEKVHELEVSQDDRAHYSKRTIDFQFDYPFGRGEL